MTNSQIILSNSLKLMEDGKLGTTGRMILMTYKNEEGEDVTERVNEPEPIHTFAEWKALGFFVNKGEKAIARFTIWNYTDKPSKKAREEAEKEGKEAVEEGHYYLKEACFFKKSQVSATAK